jgi:hypothetical protein
MKSKSLNRLESLQRQEEKKNYKKVKWNKRDNTFWNEKVKLEGVLHVCEKGKKLVNKKKKEAKIIRSYNVKNK